MNLVKVETKLSAPKEKHMNLTSLFSTEQLANQILKKFGKETLIKTTESKNDEEEEVITVTIVKNMKIPQKGERKRFANISCMKVNTFVVLSCDDKTVRAEPSPNKARPSSAAYCSFSIEEWRTGNDVP
jgi:hypothetical protein